MSTDRIVLYGSGGHAAVVLDALLLGPHASLVDVVDGNVDRQGDDLFGFRVKAPDTHPAIGETAFHVGIGDNTTRARVFTELQMAGAEPHSVVHIHATVSPRAFVGNGCFIAAKAVIAPRAKLGLGVIVNHSAVVDHDCEIGDFCHVAPAVSLGGNVQLGDHAFVGAGANILPGILIGAHARVGAGAVVVKNVPEGAVVTGVPAMIRKMGSDG